MKCPNCSTINSEDSKYCKDCGKKLHLSSKDILEKNEVKGERKNKTIEIDLQGGCKE